MRDEPSYGFNYKFLGMGGNNFNNMHWYSEVHVKQPSRTITIGDTGHESEDGWKSNVIAQDETTKLLWPRHNDSFANILWVDGHVSTEAVAGLNASPVNWDRN